jgi:predicted GNAT superfamily acetyltransferase
VIDVRPLTRTEDFEAAVQLQKEIWGFDDIELLPLRLFVVSTKVGGQVLGAFDGGHLVAFLIAIPGIRADGRRYLHSHMLGVLAVYRDRGLGRRLKFEQRREALSRGMTLVEWTFDPLELKNAFFNLERLGAVMRRFNPNQYGTTSSHLHGGLPTDRLVAEWYLASPRTEAISTGQPFERPLIEERISVPADIAEIRRSDPKRARDIQADIGQRFQEHFKRGQAVIGFEVSPAAGTYLIGPWESE